MAKKKSQESKAKKPQRSVPDRIRNVSFKLRSLLRIYLPALRDEAPKSEWSQEDLDLLVLTWRESQRVSDAMSVLDLGEYFSAGFLELCRSVGVVELPEYWGIYRNLIVPSYHATAAKWWYAKSRELLEILDPDVDCRDEKTIRRAVARWNVCDRGRLEEWADGFKDEYETAITLLALERMQTLLIWKLVPRSSLSKHEKQLLLEDERDAWQPTSEKSKETVALLNKNITKIDTLTACVLGLSAENARQIKCRWSKSPARRES